MSFQELAAALAPLGFKPWLESTDTLVRRGPGPAVYVEQCGWGAPGKGEVTHAGLLSFRATFEEIAAEMGKWFTTNEARQ